MRFCIIALIYIDQVRSSLNLFNQRRASLLTESRPVPSDQSSHKTDVLKEDFSILLVTHASHYPDFVMHTLCVPASAVLPSYADTIHGSNDSDPSLVGLQIRPFRLFFFPNLHAMLFVRSYAHCLGASKFPTEIMIYECLQDERNYAVQGQDGKRKEAPNISGDP